MRKVVLAIVAALSALLAVPAMAADGTLSSASTVYTWEGGPMTGLANGAIPAQYGLIRCSPAYQCDNEHVELKDAGGLIVEIKAGGGSEDLDVRLYASDESGSAPGFPQDPSGEVEPAQEPIAQDISTNKDAKITVRNLKPGFYVIQVASFTAANGTYNGTATFLPPAPAAAPAPATAPATTPAAGGAPQQTAPSSSGNKAAEAKRKKKLKSCQKKARKIKSSKKRKKAQRKCARKYGKKKA